MLMTLNSNNTFTADSKGVDINFNTNVLECYTDPSYSGTWILNGSTLSIVYVDSGITYTDNFTVSGNTLTYTLNDGEIVGTTNGQPVYLDSDIQFVYTKQ
jgi:hypothetical protein